MKLLHYKLYVVTSLFYFFSVRHLHGTSARAHNRKCYKIRISNLCQNSVGIAICNFYSSQLQLQPLHLVITSIEAISQSYGLLNSKSHDIKTVDQSFSNKTQYPAPRHNKKKHIRFILRKLCSIVVTFYSRRCQRNTNPCSLWRGGRLVSVDCSNISFKN